MRLIVLLLFTIFLIPSISALCENGQIDINTATLDELDQLYGIGPVKAQAIIDSRPFDSIDKLIDVYGIGEATLKGIKEQRLACVADEVNSGNSNEDTNKNISKDTGVINSSINNISSVNNNQNKTLELKSIRLNYPANSTKDIKSEENSELLSTNNQDKIAMYGFFVFSIVIGILLIIRRKKIYKNDIQ